MTHVNFSKLLSLAPTEGPAILGIDIETFPILGYFWSTFKQNIGLNQIKEDWSLMSFSAEWLDAPGNFYADNRYEDSPKDDLHLLVLLHQLLDRADFIIGRNGKKFDLPKIKARLAIKGFPPISPVQVIDPLLLNRDEFAFTSHKLEYTTGVIVPELRKSKHSKYPGFDLWFACMMHDPLAWAECEDYNRIDVASMLAEYRKLRGWYTRHPNLGSFYENVGVHVCKNCGGHHMQLQPRPTRTQVGVYQRFRCDDCGAYARGRKLIKNQEQRAHITV